MVKESHVLPIGDDNQGRRLAPRVTGALIAINIAVFLYEIAVGALSGDNMAFLYRWAAQSSEIRQGEALYSLFTSMFLHGSWLHLGSNMLYLWIFGDNVEDALGHGLYLLFYVVGGVVAGLVNAFALGISDVPSLGASGAIGAVLGAYLVLFPGRRIRVLVFLGIIFVSYVPALIMIGLWAVGQIVGGLATFGATEGGVGYWAHLGGLGFGVLAGLLCRSLTLVRPRTAGSGRW